MTILNQWTSDNCWSYAIMWILLHYWVEFDFETVSKIREPLIKKLEKRFIDLGLVEQFIDLHTIKVVDRWLDKWEHLLTGTRFWDFTLQDNEWWLIQMDEDSQHYFILCQNCWDRWKVQNSGWVEWWSNGYGYMKKSDFSKLYSPKRLVIYKNRV